MKKKPSLKTILYSSVVILIVIFSFIFLFPDTGDLKSKLFPFVGLLALLFLALGVVLICIAKKKEGRLKTFLMLTGISAVIPLVATILHNLFYGLAITFENLKQVFDILSAGFFIVSLIGAPISFVVGVVGSLVTLKREGE
jgi:hypothetical protein